MALDRDVLQRAQSNSNTSIKYPKTNRELRVDYASVKEEVTISDKTDAQIRTHPIGLIYCAPKLKRAVKILWTLTLIAYVIVLPVLVMMLFRDYSSSVRKIETLKEKWQAHLNDEAARTGGSAKVKRDVSSPMKKAFEKHRDCSKKLQELGVKLKKLVKRLKMHELR